MGPEPASFLGNRARRRDPRLITFAKGLGNVGWAIGGVIARGDRLRVPGQRHLKPSGGNRALLQVVRHATL